MAFLQNNLKSPWCYKLRTKIIAVILLFLLVALASIGATLWLSWKQEGGAAAINDAGSLRMRVTKLALDAQRYGYDPRLRVQITQEMQRYEIILERLETGDPSRPLQVPELPAIQQDLRHVKQRWHQQIKPQIEATLKASPPLRAQLERLSADTGAYVMLINHLVSAMEQFNARYTDHVRLLQLLLATMAVIGTLSMIYLMTLIVVRPLHKLHQGIEKLAAGDYGVRVQVDTRDEFGELSLGFNAMAECLSNAHALLEERIREKTASLQQKNQELAHLYEVTTFFNQAATLEELYEGFLSLIQPAFNADAAAIRLNDPGQKMVFWIADSQLPAELRAAEMSMPFGECLCGRAAQKGQIQWESMPHIEQRNCARYGYQTVGAFPIITQHRVLGAFNLYFKQTTNVEPRQLRLLEVLGQHFAVAIENRRLSANERELAVLEERNLMAQSLHDSIAQGLAFLNLQTQVMEQALQQQDQPLIRATLAQFRTGVQGSYDDVRELLNNFRSKLSGNVITSIKTVLEKFRRQSECKVEFFSEGMGAPLVPEQQLQLLFILQEALSNIRKHAQATRAVVHLQDNGSMLTLSVADDGIGFDKTAVQQRAETHLGLSIMQERAVRAGFSLILQTLPGQGTCVKLVLDATKRLAA